MPLLCRVRYASERMASMVERRELDNQLQDLHEQYKLEVYLGLRGMLTLPPPRPTYNNTPSK